jgi:general secretion pathway protein L
MPTSATEAASPDGARLLVFVDEAGALGRWLLVGDDGVADRGDAPAGLPDLSAGIPAILAVPGATLSIHWLELAADLAPAQAAAAARLMLADAVAAPLADMHVAVGRPEHGLTPVAITPAALMTHWLSLGLDPDAIVPEPLLLAVPETGLVRRDRGALADFRGPGAAFSIEPELADHLIGDAPVAVTAERDFEAGLPAALAAPVLDLRQGPFARRRQWAVERGNLRRVALLALALAALTLLVQIATLTTYAFAADEAEQEAASLATGVPGAAPAAGPGFGRVSAVLFDAIRSTPNVELTRLEYRGDGSLTATVSLDNPATLPALDARIEAAGLASESGEIRSAGGRPTADLTVRPS